MMENKKRLIDANALQLEPDPWGGMNGVLMLGRSGGKMMATVQAALRRMIENAPTVDAVEVDTAVSVVLQIALETIRQYRKAVGHDPVFEFSTKEINEIADYARSLLNGLSEMVQLHTGYPCRSRRKENDYGT